MDTLSAVNSRIRKYATRATASVTNNAIHCTSKCVAVGRHVECINSLGALYIVNTVIVVVCFAQEISATG